MQCAASAEPTGATIPAGEPRTCAIPSDCVIRVRKQRAKCCCVVELSGARVKNVATLRKFRGKPRCCCSMDRRGRRGRRVGPNAKPTARTNSPSSIVYNCSTRPCKAPAHGSCTGMERPGLRPCATRAQWAVAKILSSGSDEDTEPKMPPWALIMARPIS